MTSNLHERTCDGEGRYIFCDVKNGEAHRMVAASNVLRPSDYDGDGRGIFHDAEGRKYHWMVASIDVLHSAEQGIFDAGDRRGHVIQIQSRDTLL